MEQGAFAAPMSPPVFEESLAQDAKQKTMRHKRGGVKRKKNKKAESNVHIEAGIDDMMLDAEVETDTSAGADSSGRRNSNSSSSEPEVETSIFRQDDFPPLQSIVK
jgi:hypothetical protein